MRNHIYNKMAVALALAGALAMGACTDTWDDHYKEVTIGEGNLWQAISADNELSNFKAVLDATGYEKTLSSSQMFTIFAPVNNAFSTTQRDSVIALYQAEKAKGVKEKRNKAIVEFVQNHIALYNYSVAASTSDSIVMMNGKYMPLKGTSFAGNQFIKENVATSNGILFSLSDAASYLPNVYEYLGKDADLDSLYSFFKNYEVDYFLPSQSVPGEIIDGVTHYLDSVTMLDNDMFYNVGFLDSEDSTYWMLAPTNEVWRNQLEENINYFQYSEKTPKRDSLAYLLPRAEIILGTVFSRNLNTDRALQDSAMSTNAVSGLLREYYWGSSKKKYYQYDNPYGEGGVFTGNVDVPCSNGIVMKASEWKIDRRQTFMREIVMEGEKSASLDSVNANTQRITTYTNVTEKINEEPNPYYNQVSGNKYVAIEPAGSLSTQSVWNVSNVLSNLKYDVYIVVVPAAAGVANPSESQMLPTKMKVTLAYPDQTGKEKKTKQMGPFTTDPTRIDSLFIGTYEFPACTWGLSKPEVKVIIDGSVTNKEARENKFTKTILLDCIVFNPHVEE